MRSAMTEAESRLWQRLRAKRLNGHKFYRQVPLGNYVVDFLSHAHKLVIEVDGATHGEAHEVAYDQRRTRWLVAHGYEVLRVNNMDVFTAMDDVLDGIVWALERRASK